MVKASNFEQNRRSEHIEEAHSCLVKWNLVHWINFREVKLFEIFLNNVVGFKYMLRWWRQTFISGRILWDHCMWNWSWYAVMLTLGKIPSCYKISKLCRRNTGAPCRIVVSLNLMIFCLWSCLARFFSRVNPCCINGLAGPIFLLLLLLFNLVCHLNRLLQRDSSTEFLRFR